MTTATLTSIEEYLASAYEPDCDYVDGEIQERNVGERDHSSLQREFLYAFRPLHTAKKAFVYPEQRIQVSPRRFRVPDVCVYVGTDPKEAVFTTPPFLCIEILSPEDRISRMQVKINDYLKFGVRYVWMVDPSTRTAWVYTSSGMYEVADGVLRTENPAMEVSLAEIFSALD